MKKLTFMNKFSIFKLFQFIFLQIIEIKTGYVVRYGEELKKMFKEEIDFLNFMKIEEFLILNHYLENKIFINSSYYLKIKFDIPNTINEKNDEKIKTIVLKRPLIPDIVVYMKKDELNLFDDCDFQKESFFCHSSEVNDRIIFLGKSKYNLIENIDSTQKVLPFKLKIGLEFSNFPLEISLDIKDIIEKTKISVDTVDNAMFWSEETSLSHFSNKDHFNLIKSKKFSLK